MKPAEIHDTGMLSSSDVLKEKRMENKSRTDKAPSHDVYTEDEGVTFPGSCTFSDETPELSSGHLKEGEPESSNGNVKDDDDSSSNSAAAAAAAITGNKRVLCEGSSSSTKKRPKQHPRAIDYTLAMILDILLEIESEAAESPGIRRYTAACKRVSKRYYVLIIQFLYQYIVRYYSPSNASTASPALTFMNYYRHELDYATVASWWSARDMIIQQNSHTT